MTQWRLIYVVAVFVLGLVLYLFHCNDLRPSRDRASTSDGSDPRAPNPVMRGAVDDQSSSIPAPPVPPATWTIHGVFDCEKLGSSSVRIMGLSMIGARVDPVPFDETFSANGELIPFEIRGEGSKTIHLSYEASDGQERMSPETGVRVAPGANIDLGRFPCKGVRIRGHVLTENREPIEGYEVFIEGASQKRSLITERGGYFSSEGWEDESVRITVNVPSPFRYYKPKLRTVRVGTTPHEIRLVEKPLVHVRATLWTGEGVPPPKISMSVLEEGHDWRSLPRSKTGQFWIEPGRYSLSIQGVSGIGALWTESQAINVVERGVHHVDVAFRPCKGCGVLLVEPDSEPKGPGGIAVCVRKRSPDGSYNVSRRPSSWQLANTRAAIPLDAGTYAVQLGWIRGGVGMLSSVQEVVVAEGAVQRVKLPVNPAARVLLVGNRESGLASIVFTPMSVPNSHVMKVGHTGPVATFHHGYRAARYLGRYDVCLEPGAWKIELAAGDKRISRELRLKAGKTVTFDIRK